MSVKSPTTPSRPPDVAPVSRRGILGAIGAIGATTVAGGVIGRRYPRAPVPIAADITGRALAKPYVPGAEHYGSAEERWIATSCAQCPAGCGIRVRVVAGRAVRIEGNPDNPLNRGGVGPRGLSSLQGLYDPDRIPGPLVREGGKLVPIVWERAQAMLVERLDALRKRGAPQELLVITGRERGFMHELLARFCKTFGSPNFVDGRPSRTSVLAQAAEATVGTFEVPSYDWSNVRHVLSIESGFLEGSCQAVYFSRVAADLRRGDVGRRATLVHASPMFDLTVHNADEWLRIRPGTGGALALGICHVLLRDKLYDEGFAVGKAKGFEEFTKWVLAEFTPEKTAERVGLEAERIVEVARQLATRRPSFVVTDERALAYTNGWETALAVLALNGLLGALGRQVRIEPAPPYAKWPEPELDDVARAGLAKPRLDRAGTPEFPRARCVHETIPEAIAGAGVVLLDNANPVWARAQPDRWRKALASVPFVVSFSPFRDESVESVAHLVLPDHTFLERWEDAGAAPGVGVPVVGVRRPVVAPLLDTRATGDVILDAAHALGDSMRAAFPWDTFRHAIEPRLRGLYEARRGSFVETSERTFLRRLFDVGVWVDAAPRYDETAVAEVRATWADPQWEGDPSAFPLALIPYRPIGYAPGGGMNLPWLRSLRGRPEAPAAATYVSFHPGDAPGLKEGDPVEVTSPFGTIACAARPDERMQPGCAAIPLDGGHEAFGRFAIGRGANVRRILRPGPAPTTGADLLGSTRVRIARASAPLPNPRTVGGIP